MKFTRRTLTAAFAASSTTLLTSCGTMFYPDRRTSRKDQTMSGEIDWFIFALDTVGLFFFLVPGIVAFAVDFGTGAIFVPEGGEILDNNERTLFDEMKEEARISTPVQPEELFTVLEEKTGNDLRKAKVVACEIDSMKNIGEAYAQLRSTHESIKI